MALTLESTSTQAFAEGSITFTKPTGVAVDDILIWVVGCSDLNSISTPSGWTNIAAPATTGGNNDMDPYIFYKIADLGDVAATDYSIDVADGTGPLGGIMVRFSGGDVHTPYEQLSQDDDESIGTSRSHTLSVTPTFADSILVAVGSGEGTGANSAYASTGTPTWTEQFDAPGTGVNDFMFVVTAPYSTTTEVTSFTFTNGNSIDRTDVAMFVVRPRIDGDGVFSTDNAAITSGATTISSSTNVSVGQSSVEVTSNTPTAPAYDPVWTTTPKS